MIFGIAGSCKSEELYKLRTHNVKEMAPMFVISIPPYKNNPSRSFTVGQKFHFIIKKYLNLRSEAMPTNFFIKCQNGQFEKEVSVQQFQSIKNFLLKFFFNF